jgi:hypothetical protein
LHNTFDHRSTQKDVYYDANTIGLLDTKSIQTEAVTLGGSPTNSLLQLIPSYLLSFKTQPGDLAVRCLKLEVPPYKRYQRLLWAS